MATKKTEGKRLYIVQGVICMNSQIFIEKLSFNDGTELKIGHSDIIIFTGANNAGKSQVLKDIDTMMDSKGAKGIVSTSLEMQYAGEIKEMIDDYKTKDGKYRIGGNIFKGDKGQVPLSPYSFVKDIQMIFCTVLGKNMEYAGEVI